VHSICASSDHTVPTGHFGHDLMKRPCAYLLVSSCTLPYQRVHAEYRTVSRESPSDTENPRLSRIESGCFFSFSFSFVAPLLRIRSQTGQVGSSMARSCLILRLCLLAVVVVVAVKLLLVWTPCGCRVSRHQWGVCLSVFPGRFPDCATPYQGLFDFAAFVMPRKEDVSGCVTGGEVSLSGTCLETKRGRGAYQCVVVSLLFYVNGII